MCYKNNSVYTPTESVDRNNPPRTASIEAQENLYKELLNYAEEIEAILTRYQKTLADMRAIGIIKT